MYVGQIKNSFFTRLRSHRFMWNKALYIPSIYKNHEDTALIYHISKVHRNDNKTILNTLTFSDYYTLIFVHQPNMESLDIKENFWISKTNATTNIKRTFLSKCK